MKKKEIGDWKLSQSLRKRLQLLTDTRTDFKTGRRARQELVWCSSETACARWWGARLLQTNAGARDPPAVRNFNMPEESTRKSLRVSVARRAPSPSPPHPHLHRVWRRWNAPALRPSENGWAGSRPEGIRSVSVGFNVPFVVRFRLFCFCNCFTRERDADKPSPD